MEAREAVGVDVEEEAAEGVATEIVEGEATEIVEGEVTVMETEAEVVTEIVVRAFEQHNDMLGM